MPSRQGPGVYVTEVSSGIRIVIGADTSTPAFIGLTFGDGTEKGRSAPVRIGSWAEFDQQFMVRQGAGLLDGLKKAAKLGDDAVRGALSAATGGSISSVAAPDRLDEVERYLPLAEAVRGFFDNGGSPCYVVPVAVEDDQYASLLAAIEGDAEAGTGLAGLEQIHDVQMVAAPDAAVWATTLDDLAACAQLLTAHCVKMANRVAILDTLATQTPQDLADGLDLGLTGRRSRTVRCTTRGCRYPDWTAAPARCRPAATSPESGPAPTEIGACSRPPRTRLSKGSRAWPASSRTTKWDHSRLRDQLHAHLPRSRASGLGCPDARAEG
ncbi:hypothetical protein ACFYMW_39670 [Streptomyces sp. NPDC006692]|uniref:hypothetical protein n=1 Tax=Streptomyces sp. NPDC006692 TaxID=3364758 RepID=UPI0036781326